MPDEGCITWLITLCNAESGMLLPNDIDHAGLVVKADRPSPGWRLLTEGVKADHDLTWARPYSMM